MVKRILKFLISGLGILVGYGVVALIFQANVLNIGNNVVEIAIYVVVMLMFGIIMYMLSEKIMKSVIKLLDSSEKILVEVPPVDIVFGAVGLLFGLILSFFISAPFRSIDHPLWNSIGLIITIIIYVILGTIGARMAIRYKGDVIRMFHIKTEDNKSNLRKRCCRFRL